MDFIFYWRHRLYHCWMRKWHRTHHNDIGYDISLTLRFHPFENLVNYLIFLMGILFLKISPWEAVFILQLFAFQAILSHTGNSQTEPAEMKLWDRLFITPKVHRLHHEFIQIDGNYGFLFSIWDQIFGTFILAKILSLKEKS